MEFKGYVSKCIVSALTMKCREMRGKYVEDKVLEKSKSLVLCKRTEGLIRSTILFFFILSLRNSKVSGLMVMDPDLSLQDDENIEMMRERGRRGRSDLALALTVLVGAK